MSEEINCLLMSEPADQEKKEEGPTRSKKVVLARHSLGVCRGEADLGVSCVILCTPGKGQEVFLGTTLTEPGLFVNSVLLILQSHHS